MAVALFLQAGDASVEYLKWLTIFVGIIAVILVLVMVVMGAAAIKVMSLVGDAKKSFAEAKVKAMPMIATATDITQTARGIVADLAPKIKTVSDNVVETSHTIRQTVTKLDGQVRDVADKAADTFTDANGRTKAQVARVDGLIASALTATAELGATINEGIRTPARKIASLVTQSKQMVDGLVDRAKALGINIGSTVEAKVNPKTTKSGW